MAGTGGTPISLFYSTTAATYPTTGQLVNGELFINITDGVLKYKDGSGTIQTIATKAAASGSFSGGVTGNVTGNLTGNVTGNITGSLKDGSGNQIFYSAGNLFSRASGNMYFQNQAGSVNYFYTDTSGNLTATGNVTAYSDERLKSDVYTIQNALDLVDQMRGVGFIKDGKAGIGVIAQEMQKVMPQVVIEGEYLSVAYGNLVGVLIEAVKELRAEVKALKGE